MFRKLFSRRLSSMKLPQWDYEEYGDWARILAKNYTITELKKMLAISEKAQPKNMDSHWSAVNVTHSMQSNSQRRAQTGNVVRGNYEKRRALQDAIEIHEFYPEHSKAAA